MNISGYECVRSRTRPRIVSRKFALPPQTGTSMATLNTIAVVCSHQGSGLNRK